MSAAFAGISTVLAFWCNESSILEKLSGIDQLIGELSTHFAYVFDDGSTLVSEGQLERHNKPRRGNDCGKQIKGNSRQHASASRPTRN
jgi:hypothetical protein